MRWVSQLMAINGWLRKTATFLPQFHSGVSARGISPGIGVALTAMYGFEI